MQTVKERLTPGETSTLELLKSVPGGILRKHARPSRVPQFRLLDGARNPIKNVPVGMIKRLIDKKWLEVQPGEEYKISE